MTFGWEHSTGGTLFTAHPPNSETQAENLKARLISHYIVDLMPEPAVLNLLEEIVQIWEDYQATLRAPLPAPVAQRRVLKARITKRYDRPTFELVGE